MTKWGDYYQGLGVESDKKLGFRHLEAGSLSSPLSANPKELGQCGVVGMLGVSDLRPSSPYNSPITDEWEETESRRIRLSLLIDP